VQHFGNPIFVLGIGSRYDSITDCEKAMRKSQKQAQHDKDAELESAAEMDANPTNQVLATLEAARLLKCVSTDDPRLKKH
jgi:hypothetical protein